MNLNENEFVVRDLHAQFSLALEFHDGNYLISIYEKDLLERFVLFNNLDYGRTYTQYRKILGSLNSDTWSVVTMRVTANNGYETIYEYKGSKLI